MLHCNMTTATSIQLGLEDLLADLHHARRHEELGRLALLCYCELRSWARQAGEPGIGERSTTMFTQSPSVCKEEYLAMVDVLIAELESLQPRYTVLAPQNPFASVRQRAPLQSH
jgi:hypothetical protein